MLSLIKTTSRAGQNLQEAILTTGNVQSSLFGKLFTLPVDGIIDAEPLYLSAVSIPGKGRHKCRLCRD
jgi:hypothetical protein